MKGSGSWHHSLLSSIHFIMSASAFTSSLNVAQACLAVGLDFLKPLIRSIMLRRAVPYLSRSA
ncbi:MAG: hypothetical protein CFE31_09420 [Rhizobiales bacterium PAR1]|nr:MAG: hypothetical protein CFE31_09420 [Rhizobiales bacterium PAR1]